MSDDTEEGCLAVLLWMVWFIPGTLLGGWVVMLLWGWFIVPLGVAAIGFWHAIGLNIILNFVQNQQANDNDDPLAAMAAIIGGRILMAALALGVGWVVLQLMGA